MPPNSEKLFKKGESMYKRGGPHQNPQKTRKQTRKKNKEKRSDPKGKSVAQPPSGSPLE